ncbi:MAG: polyprenyl diphosphate synthase, partial [Candidatus Dependentiae bacterium]|nr:polyprenyl diphosphate synthase [Candidatus Dependentiae bacterium]
MIKHLACIMDGNRRWAQQRSLMPWYGHSQGAEAIKTVMRFCLENGIRYLSLYAFSIENLKRSAIEKEYIFSYIVSEAHKQLPDFLERGIKIRFLGDTSLFPAAVLSTCRMLEQATEQGTSLYVQVLFCYGARQELLSATKEIVRSIALGELTVDDITQETL